MERGISIHIGVNHPAGLHEPLSESEDTAWKLAELSFQAGYRAIHLLRGAEATREAVGALLLAASRTLRPGHTLFVSFSGHGSRVRDAEGDEPDGYDETWCLHDADLVDDELAEFWRQLPRGARALVVADCCYAAGSIRKGEPMAWCGARPRVAEDEIVYRGVKQYTIAPDLVTEPADADGIGASVLLLAATGKQQKAKEGVYVKHLLDVWARGAHRGTFSELHEEVRKRVMGETHDQEPQLVRLGAADPGFLRKVAFHLDQPVMRGGGPY
jgi:hypothetical protein